MFFQTWSDFFDMGGYGFYVWLAYGISLLCIMVLIIQSYKGKDVVLREIRREQQRQARQQAAQRRMGGL
ncbi:heme exporter protein CcmD [Conservatibacter flavescens]|uniref:Heme exporter protein D n=1 Tax=Conservatibacter flavescens TaxID=28161 RepID=A0A2M8S2C3_9PAST|nr:heme exporter protein CcmD [Conservatibacter flavescens]PJG85292.1 heme exporter protein CcmD [Conservatibacter flavescens]